METPIATSVTPEMLASLQAELEKVRKEKEAAEQAATELNLQLASKDLAMSKKVKTIILDDEIYECYAQRFINPEDSNTYLVDDLLTNEAGKEILRKIIKKGSQTFKKVQSTSDSTTTTRIVAPVNTNPSTTAKAKK
jgi:hypothetical protein